MKGLVLAPQPFFTPRGTPFSVYYRAKTMADLGEELDLLTYGQGKDVDIENVRLFRTPRLRLLGDIRTGPSLLKIVHDGFLLLYALSRLARCKYDYVHAHEEGVFIARLLKPIFRYKLLYDMHSSLPEQLDNFGYTRSRVIHSLFRWAERDAVRQSDAVIVVCPSLLDYARTLADDADKVVLIENSVFDAVALSNDAEAERPNAAIESAKALVESGHPLIVYTGTLESYQGIALLLEAFGHLRADHDRARLLIVGGDPGKVARYKKTAAELGLSDRCLFSGTVSPTTALACYGLATMLVSPRLTGTNTPMKIYGQLASRVPVVATRIETHTQVLNDNVAFLVEPDSDDLARGMKSVLDDPESARRRAENAKELYEKRYSRAAYVDATREVIGLLGG